MPNYPAKLKKMGWILGAAAGLSLAVCVGAAARTRQEQGQGQQDQGPEPKAKPVYPPQDADKPPYSNDRRGRSASEGQDQARQPDAAGQVAQSSKSAREVPESLVVPAGTILLVRMNEFLSSDRNQIGDPFTAE